MSYGGLGALKRFYKTAAAAPRDGGGAVLLDGRPLRTPSRAAFLLPTVELAEICAAEWDAQIEIVRPETMPITKLANVALDHTPAARTSILENIAGYAATDLVCHRADKPEALVERQTRAWDPLILWAADALKAPLFAVPGVIAGGQSEAAAAAFTQRAATMDDFRLTGLAHATGTAGSGVIGFALALGRLDAVAAFETACLDEIWQLEIWGEDDLARERLERLEAEFLSLGQFFSALR